MATMVTPTTSSAMRQEFQEEVAITRHVLDRVTATAADSDDLDDCFLRILVDDFEHGVLLLLSEC